MAREGQSQFVIIPYYTGDRTLDQILSHPKSVGMLWLEILLNGNVPWETHLDDPRVRAAYEKACIWYSHFKTMITGHTGRSPLKASSGKIDMKEYRKLQEALIFVASRS